MRNTAIAAEVLITLDLVKTVVQNIVPDGYGFLKERTDCKVVYELLTDERLKSSQCELDGGFAISKNIEIEKKSNVQFDNVHVKTKQGTEAIDSIYGKKSVLECDCKAKKERIKYEEDCKHYNLCVRGNTCLKHRDRHCENKISEVIKKIDSARKLEEYFQDNHG